MEGIYAYADQIKVYKAILDATQEIQKYLRYHSGKSIKKLWSFWHAKKSGRRYKIHWTELFFNEDFLNFKNDYESTINRMAYFKISHAIRDKRILKLYEIIRFDFKRVQFAGI